MCKKHLNVIDGNVHVEDIKQSAGDRQNESVCNDGGEQRIPALSTFACQN